MKLPFKTTQDFFEYCNGQFPANPRKGEGRPALVPPPGYMNIENHVSQTPDGRFRVSLMVSGAPDGFFLIAETPNSGGNRIQHGDLVIWEAFNSPPPFGKGTMGNLTGDKRSSWVGFIVANVAPEIDEQGMFTVTGRYR